MIWIERFDGRWERATTLREALDRPVRAYALGPRAARTRAGLDPSGVRGAPERELRRRIARPRGAARPHGRRATKAERCLGPVECP